MGDDGVVNATAVASIGGGRAAKRPRPHDHQAIQDLPSQPSCGRGGKTAFLPAAHRHVNEHAGAQGPVVAAHRVPFSPATPSPIATETIRAAMMLGYGFTVQNSVSAATG